MGIYFMVCLIVDRGSKRQGMGNWLCMRMGILIKDVEGKSARLRTNRSVSHQDLREFAYNLPSALSLPGKRHRLEWVEFSCVTLNNGGGCMCVYAGNQYAGVICVFSSISVDSAGLIHSEKFIDIHTCTLPTPHTLAVFLSAGLPGRKHFNLFAVIDLGLVRSYVWKWDKASAWWN